MPLQTSTGRKVRKWSHIRGADPSRTPSSKETEQDGPFRHEISSSSRKMRGRSAQVHDHAQRHEDRTVLHYRRNQPGRKAKVHQSIEHDSVSLETSDGSFCDLDSTSIYSPTAHDNDFEPSPRDWLAQAHGENQRASDQGCELLEPRAPSEASLSLDGNRTSSMDRAKRELTVAMEEASHQADSLQEKDKRLDDGLVGRASDSSREGEITSLRRLVAEMAKIVMEICKMELNAVSPQEAPQEGDTLVERANQAVEDFRAAAAPGANGPSALASRRRIDEPIPAPRLRDSPGEHFRHSFGRRQHRSATMPPSASQWFGPSMDRASRQLTGTSHGVGNGDDQYNSPRPAKHERRDGQQCADESRHSGSTPATGGSTRSHDDPSALNPQCSPSLFLSGPVSPDEQGRSPSQFLVPQSAEAVEGRQVQGKTTSIIPPENPAQSATPSKRRQRSRQASTISPCQRSSKRNGHVQFEGLQSKQHVAPTNARDRATQPTVSHTTPVPTISIDQTDMNLLVPHSNVPDMPANIRNPMAPSVVNAASLSTAAPSRGIHLASVNAHSSIAGAETLEKGSLGNSTGGSPSVETSSSCSKRRAVSIAGLGGILDHGRAKKAKTDGQERSCGNGRVGNSQAKRVQHKQGGRCSMMLDSSMTFGKGVDLNTVETSPVSKPGNDGQKVETSREDSELPDLATTTQQYPASRKDMGSQRYAGSQRSATEAPARDQEPQDVSAGNRLCNTTNPGPTVMARKYLEDLADPISFLGRFRCPQSGTRREWIVATMSETLVIRGSPIPTMEFSPTRIRILRPRVKAAAEFMVHCEQVEACSGHSNVTREACREALRAEQSNIRKAKPKGAHDASGSAIGEGISFPKTFLANDEGENQVPSAQLDRSNFRDGSMVPPPIWYGKEQEERRRESESREEKRREFRIPPGYPWSSPPAVSSDQIDQLFQDQDHSNQASSEHSTRPREGSAAAHTSSQCKDKSSSLPTPIGLATPAGSSPNVGASHGLQSTCLDESRSPCTSQLKPCSRKDCPKTPETDVAEEPVTSVAASKSKTEAKRKEKKKLKGSETLHSEGNPASIPSLNPELGA
ncbi:MAG: hypothetical protein Q9200_001888 [Gallowayella weberi]